MVVIYKYPLKLVDGQDVNMPHGARLLTAQMQNDELCMWAEVDLDRPIGQRRINVIGTGWMYGGGYIGNYIATAQDGPFVWHVFDEGYCA